MSSTWIVGAAGVAFGVEFGEGSAGLTSSGKHDDHLAAVVVEVAGDGGCWKRSADRNGHIGTAGNVLFLGVEMPLTPVVLVAASAHRRR